MQFSICYKIILMVKISNVKSFRDETIFKTAIVRLKLSIFFSENHVLKPHLYKYFFFFTGHVNSVRLPPFSINNLLCRVCSWNWTKNHNKNESNSSRNFQQNIIILIGVRCKTHSNAKLNKTQRKCENVQKLTDNLN